MTDGSKRGDANAAEDAAPKAEKTAIPGAAPGKDLPPAAVRALREAAERRAKADDDKSSSAREKGGPSGLDPTRYGDWERKGRTVDFS